MFLLADCAESASASGPIQGTDKLDSVNANFVKSKLVCSYLKREDNPMGMGRSPFSFIRL